MAGKVKGEVRGDSRGGREGGGEGVGREGGGDRAGACYRRPPSILITLISEGVGLLALLIINELFLLFFFRIKYFWEVYSYIRLVFIIFYSFIPMMDLA